MSNSDIPTHTFPDACWKRRHIAGIDLWRSLILDSLPWLAHAFTGAGFNLSERRGPDCAGTPRRRDAVCSAIGAPPAMLTCGEQVHAARVALVEDEPGEDGFRAIVGADGLATRAIGRPLMARSADCPLIVLAGTNSRALGLAHSGWRGTLERMPRRLAEALICEYEVDPNELVAVVAPHAQACCYEVGQDVWSLVEKDWAETNCLRRADGKVYLDLGRLIAYQLIDAGVRAEAVHLTRMCTICDHRFHSYRRDGVNTGLSGLFVCRNE